MPPGAIYPFVVCASILSGIPSPSESKSKKFGNPSPSVSVGFVKGLLSASKLASSMVSRIPSLSSSRSASLATPSSSSSGNPEIKLIRIAESY